MFRLKFAAAVLMTLGLLGFAATSDAQRPVPAHNRLTFPAPVRLPGVMLLPGTYEFEAGAAGTHPSIVRVISANNRTLHFLAFTQKIDRPADLSPNTVVRFEEVPPEAPKPIAEWFPAGTKSGYRFIYR